MTDAEKFLTYDYAETKDLLKTFITLISGTIVLSLTFGGNAIGRAAPILLIGALVLAGMGMAFIAAAAGKAVYGEIPLLKASYWRLALIAWAFVVAAGLCFVAGLSALALATGAAAERGTATPPAVSSAAAARNAR